MSETLADRRARLMGPNVPTFYGAPLHLVRGEGVWLWDADGRRYLDAYNNVPHVGHGHPRVVAAIAGQAARLNTHTRYGHDLVLDLIERLGATFTVGHDLTQAILVCTGSEANDIALRMAQAVTGRTGIIATDATYHGNTTAVSQLNARRPPIGARWPNVRLVPAPDPLHRPDPDGARFGAGVAAAAADLEASGFGAAALILCPVFANEGLPVLPSGWLAPAEAAIRAAGGLVIADEVQPGFGRSGPAFWGHQRMGLRPDIVTMGKPMGNGHPVAAVMTRPDVMAAFRGAFGYFNTFGGNPVSAAAALAVLDILRDEEMIPRAMAAAAHLDARLAGITHPMLVERRSAGLFFGLVFENAGVPAPATAMAVVRGLLDAGILTNVIGMGQNIVKVRPPMPFGRAEADLFADTLAEVLARLPDGR